MRFRKIFDYYFQEVNFVYAFWAMFWGLNGLDKFFIGIGAEDGATCAFADGRGTPCGWFGTNRAGQMTAYFDKLGLPEWLALTTLYGVALLEIVLGGLFVWMLLRNIRHTVAVSHTMHRVAFKGSLFVFFLFMTGDILFGDRRELWEHGTFMILVIITFGLYAYRNELRAVVVKEIEDKVTGPLERRVRESMHTMTFKREFHPDE